MIIKTILLLTGYVVIGAKIVTPLAEVVNTTTNVKDKVSYSNVVNPGARNFLAADAAKDFYEIADEAKANLEDGELATLRGGVTKKMKGMKSNIGWVINSLLDELVNEAQSQKNSAYYWNDIDGGARNSMAAGAAALPLH